MARYSKAIYALLAAIGFCGFFGLLLPSLMTGRAAGAIQSIEPAMNAAVLSITFVLVALAIRDFLRARKE